MKPFDLEKAKAGQPIATLEGWAATFITHIPYAHKDHCVIVMVDGNSIPEFFNKDGEGTEHTLVMKPMVKYANLYNNIDGKFIIGSTELYDTKEKAHSFIDQNDPLHSYLKTIAIQVR